jgi:hypothetical protein
MTTTIRAYRIPRVPSRTDYILTEYRGVTLERFCKEVVDGNITEADRISKIEIITIPH